MKNKKNKEGIWWNFNHMRMYLVETLREVNEINTLYYVNL